MHSQNLRSRVRQISVSLRVAWFTSACSRTASKSHRETLSQKTKQQQQQKEMQSNKIHFKSYSKS
ncbi:hypothetical protein ACQP3F_26155, partial [Escherichia coli]